MRISSISIFAAWMFAAPSVTGFVTRKTLSVHKSTVTFLGSTQASSAESEADRLLRKARELRELAAQAEHQIHVDLAEKRDQHNVKMDALIQSLFFDKTNDLVTCLKEKHLSIDTLEQIIDRLDEREVVAEGKEHVKLVDSESGGVEFQRFAERNELELQQLEGKIEALVEAVSILDEEFRKAKESKGEVYASHTEDQHWGAGKMAERLTNRAHEIRREREEQFQQRLQEFYEAQRIKDDLPPPPKLKDDHGLVP